ncbi:hypothetical protein OBBRIDRAFT_823932 [Obba rivulosa]|uniref:Uncharacterized protein n=1 Tax=Obba rivulosa TaxID=1052685 RepID=A0A8E2DQ30_9APHY|nr:hypothetical protein OBBRIDRAFT_823932 [Obba rivulosa]
MVGNLAHMTQTHVYYYCLTVSALNSVPRDRQWEWCAAGGETVTDDIAQRTTSRLELSRASIRAVFRIFQRSDDYRSHCEKFDRINCKNMFGLILQNWDNVAELISVLLCSAKDACNTRR